MSLLRSIAKTLAPDLMDAGEVRRFAMQAAPDLGLMTVEQVKDLVADEVRKVRQALPTSVEYDPHNEGYRRLTGDTDLHVRDLTPMAQDLMFELAYYLYDTSGLVKRFVRDTKNFVLGEGVDYTVHSDPDGQAKEWLDTFWNDSVNAMDLRLEKRIEFLCLLGEQCWPVQVEPITGKVRTGYIDPTNIDTVDVSPFFPELVQAVNLRGMGGRRGATLTAIREEWDPRKKEFGRMVGDVLFFSINNPPNSPRGRSDLIQNFDFINNLEEGLFDEIDRIRMIKAFIWDVTLTGADDEGIRKFLSSNKTPKPGSVRAHNERVAWQAVAPDLKTQDSKQFFDYLKSYLAACQNRPDSWLGGGGKAYQTEADLMGEPTFKDLGSRQRYVKSMIQYMLQFVLDQGVLHGSLRETEGRFKAVVSMPEMAEKDLKKIVDGLFTLAQALMIAETQQWVTGETAAKVFASVAERVGVEIDAAEEVRKTATETVPKVTEDYAAREALLDELVARLELRAA